MKFTEAIATLTVIAIIQEASSLIDQVNPESKIDFTLKDFHQQYFQLRKMDLGMYPIDIGLISKTDQDKAKPESFKEIWIAGYADLNSDSK